MKNFDPKNCSRINKKQKRRKKEMNGQKEKMAVVLMAVVMFGIVSFGFVGSAAGLNYTAPDIEISVSEIYMDHSETGSGNVSIHVLNDLRLVSVWASQNRSLLKNFRQGEKYTLSKEIGGVNISVGKDYGYVDFGLGEINSNLTMGISPRWNQTLEIYVSGKVGRYFEIWGLILSGYVWNDGKWVIDNPNYQKQNVLLAVVWPGSPGVD